MHRRSCGIKHRYGHYGQGNIFCPCPVIERTSVAVPSYLWSRGHTSWLQVQRSSFDSLRHQIFWEVVGLERDPLSLLSTTAELIGIKCSDSGLESREYGRRNLSLWPRGTLCPQKLTPTSLKSGGRSVGIYTSIRNYRGKLIRLAENSFRTVRTLQRTSSTCFLRYALVLCYSCEMGNTRRVGGLAFGIRRSRDCSKRPPDLVERYNERNKKERKDKRLK
jgi:hypothetical protein